MKLITITLNPAFDVHCYAEDFKPYHENLATVTEREAGGKGVNISRALSVNHIKNTALIVTGAENRADFISLLNKDSIEYCEIQLEGRIRENITLHTNNAPETRISFAGFDTNNSLLALVEEKLASSLEGGDIVTFTGRVPSGIDMEEVKAFLKRLQAKGARLVIDSRSFSKDDLLEMTPWLIKPNEEEISVYLEREINGFDSVLDGARELCSRGIENVMVSLGAEGALLVREDGCFVACPPKIEAVSTIGAGDSSIGGFLAAAYMGESPEGMLQRAVAYGSAACMSAGTRPPLPEDVESIYSRIELKRI